jgi:signal transduction histidine kinase
MTSVNVSAGLAVRRMRSSRIDGLLQATALLREQGPDLARFLTRDRRGELLLDYLGKVSQALARELREIATELDRLSGNVSHIMDIVAIQQANAGQTRLDEPVDVEAVAEDAIRINAESLERHQVTVVRCFASLPALILDRVRLLLILVNLVSNAKAALAAVHDRPRIITLTTSLREGNLLVLVEDSGEGIRSEDLARIFAHGFTTRREGHGFGLHSCSIAAGEMGGRLMAYSAGPGYGARFTLRIPVTVEGETC